MPEPDQIAFEQACSELGLPLEPGETPAHWAFRYAALRDAQVNALTDTIHSTFLDGLTASASQHADPAISSTTQRQEETPAEEDSLP